jgi:hypothetical protein
MPHGFQFDFRLVTSGPVLHGELRLISTRQVLAHIFRHFDYSWLPVSIADHCFPVNKYFSVTPCCPDCYTHLAAQPQSKDCTNSTFNFVSQHLHPFAS